jgi:hypothetical protein
MGYARWKIVRASDYRALFFTNCDDAENNDEQGPGDYSIDPGSLDLQTHTTPVPEPTTAWLIAIAGLLRFSRRRRG